MIGINAFNQVADLLNFYLRLTHAGDLAQFKFEEVILKPYAPLRKAA